MKEDKYVRRLNDVFGGEASRLNTVVEHLDGKVFDLYGQNVVTRDFIVSSPTYSRDMIYLDGGYGAIESNVTLEPRNIVIHFWMRADDVLKEYVSLRDFVFNVFGRGKPFYITDSREPTKRWLVILESGFEMEQTDHYGFFEVPLLALKGVSETSNIITRNYRTSKFNLYNPGDVEVKMVNQEETEINFYGISSRLAILNHTNGEVWTFDGDTQSNSTITLRGVRSYRNGIPIFRDTNKQVLQLEVGNNEIEIIGASGDFEVEVKTRWYFL